MPVRRPAPRHSRLPRRLIAPGVRSLRNLSLYFDADGPGWPQVRKAPLHMHTRPQSSPAAPPPALAPQRRLPSSTPPARCPSIRSCTGC
jgi:hypothetical protein